MTVHVLSYRDKAPEGAVVVDTTTRADGWSRALSPMIATWHGVRVENVWQYSKVYPQHWDQARGTPTPEWDAWRDEGWSRNFGQRYPMGKGAVPVCSWVGPWNAGRALDYIAARKGLYVPCYRDAIRHTPAFLSLRTLADQGDVWLRDFDGYDFRAMGLTLEQVLEDPNRKMGHAFVLAAMLEGNL